MKNVVQRLFDAVFAGRCTTDTVCITFVCWAARSSDILGYAVSHRCPFFPDPLVRAGWLLRMLLRAGSCAA